MGEHVALVGEQARHASCGSGASDVEGSHRTVDVREGRLEFA